MSQVERRCHVVWLALAALCLCALACSVAAFAQSPNAARHIVVFQPWFTDEGQQQAVVRAAGGQALRNLPIINAVAAGLPPGVEKQLARRAEVARVDADALAHALGKPSPPPPPQQLPWGVNRIDAEWTWATYRGAQVKVAVIDTGIDQDHPDLVANIAGGVNFVSRPWWRPADPSLWDDKSGHGTHVAGIIGAVDNAIGVIGVAPDVRLYGVRVLDKNGSGYISDIVAGVDWAVANGMDIANLSLGTDSDVQSLHDACDNAAAAGLLIVAAAGNDGKDVDYPGAYSSVIAVAATDINDLVASWSSPGPQVYVAAPGVSVRSTWKGGGYATASGTSMAAPHVAGTLALMLSAGATPDPCFGADDLLPVGPDIYSGCGLLDAGEAVTGIPNYGDNLP